MRQNRWFHRWIDEVGITTHEQADRAIRTPAHWARLVELAAAHDSEPEVAPFAHRSISAGRSLDLTAFLACGHPDCLTQQVDRLFARVWHYFDKIAVVGADAHRILDLVESHRDSTAKNLMAAMTRVILHARATGAEKFLVFVDKPPACDVHWPEYVEDPRFHLPDDALAPIAGELLQNGKITFKKRHCAKCDDWFIYSGKGPAGLTESVRASRAFKRRSAGMTVHEAVVLSVLDKYMLGAASDLHASEELGLPIGLGIAFEARLLRSLRPTPTEQQIAFSLQLPVVEGLGVTELLALRESESDAFEAFRLSLQHAMRERLDADGTADSASIAAEIQDDILEPSLIDLRRRLTAQKTALNQKRIAHAVGIAGLTTVCGLLGGPAALAPVVLAAASAGKTELDAIDKRVEAQSDNMYFLWKVDHAAKDRAKSNKKKRKRR